MRNDRISESATLKVTQKTQRSWNEMLATVRKEGMLAAKRKAADGHHFEAAILAPLQVKGGDSIPLAGAIIPLDWKLAKKREMVASARDFMTAAYMCGALDPALPVVLQSVIEERGLYEYGIGEFFSLYGRFEQKYETHGKQTKSKMDQLVAGNAQYLKRYSERGRQELHPLPYAVRNILSHAGHNPNKLDQEGRDLRTSIDLLKRWVQ